MPFLTLPVAMGIAAAGSTAAGIYGTRSAGKQNRRAQDLQREESRLALEDAAAERALLAEQVARQAALEERKQTEAQARWNQAMAQDQARWQDYLRANEPHWTFGGRVLSSLYDLAGMPGGAPAMPDAGTLGGLSFDGRRATVEGGAPMLPLDTMAAGGMPVSTTRPVPMASAGRRSRYARRPFAPMATPASGGMSLSDLASLATLASARTPIQGRTIRPDVNVTRAPVAAAMRY